MMKVFKTIVFLLAGGGAECFQDMKRASSPFSKSKLHAWDFRNMGQESIKKPIDANIDVKRNTTILFIHKKVKNSGNDERLSSDEKELVDLTNIAKRFSIQSLLNGLSSNSSLWSQVEKLKRIETATTVENLYVK